jgi:hypothetical protein
MLLARYNEMLGRVTHLPEFPVFVIYQVELHIGLAWRKVSIAVAAVVDIHLGDKPSHTPLTPRRPQRFRYDIATNEHP